MEKILGFVKYIFKPIGILDFFKVFFSFSILFLFLIYAFTPKVFEYRGSDNLWSAYNSGMFTSYEFYLSSAIFILIFVLPYIFLCLKFFIGNDKKFIFYRHSIFTMFLVYESFEIFYRLNGNPQIFNIPISLIFFISTSFYTCFTLNIIYDVSKIDKAISYLVFLLSFACFVKQPYIYLSIVVITACINTIKIIKTTKNLSLEELKNSLITYSCPTFINIKNFLNSNNPLSPYPFFMLYLVLFTFSFVYISNLNTNLLSNIVIQGNLWEAMFNAFNHQLISIKELVFYIAIITVINLVLNLLLIKKRLVSITNNIQKSTIVSIFTFFICMCAHFIFPSILKYLANFAYFLFFIVITFLPKANKEISNTVDENEPQNEITEHSETCEPEE